jgi:hypothetical protein
MGEVQPCMRLRDQLLFDRRCTRRITTSFFGTSSSAGSCATDQARGHALLQMEGIRDGPRLPRTEIDASNRTLIVSPLNRRVPPPLALLGFGGESHPTSGRFLGARGDARGWRGTSAVPMVGAPGIGAATIVLELSITAPGPHTHGGGEVEAVAVRLGVVLVSSSTPAVSPGLGVRHGQRTRPTLAHSVVWNPVVRKRLQFYFRDLGFLEKHSVRPQEPPSLAELKKPDLESEYHRLLTQQDNLHCKVRVTATAEPDQLQDATERPVDE